MQLPDLTHIESVWPLVVTVFTMSVLGSLHCAGMCGGLMFFALGSDQSDDEDGTTRKHSKIRLQFAYHGGRLVTYTSGSSPGSSDRRLTLVAAIWGSNAAR